MLHLPNGACLYDIFRIHTGGSSPHIDHLNLSQRQERPDQFEADAGFEPATFGL